MSLGPGHNTFVTTCSVYHLVQSLLKIVSDHSRYFLVTSCDLLFLVLLDWIRPHPATNLLRGTSCTPNSTLDSYLSTTGPLPGTPSFNRFKDLVELDTVSKWVTMRIRFWVTYGPSVSLLRTFYNLQEPFSRRKTSVHLSRVSGDTTSSTPTPPTLSEIERQRLKKLRSFKWKDFDIPQEVKVGVNNF